MLHRMSQEERSAFWKVIILVILSKKVYVHVSYSEQFPRFTVQYTVHYADKQHTMFSHDLQNALVLMEF
jgi:hypothetical protein